MHGTLDARGAVQRGAGFVSSAIAWGLAMGRRAGRKRKIGAREKNGRLQRRGKAEVLEEAVRVARAMPHRRRLRSNDRIDARAESPLGRLNVRGAISAGEYAAGETFAAIVGRYRAVIEGPRPVRSLSIATSAELGDVADLEGVAERFSCPAQWADPAERQVRIAGALVKVRVWPCGAEGETCHCAQRRERYMRAYDALAQAGRPAIMAVTRIAVRGEEPTGAEDLVNLTRGLRALKRHLRLTDADD